MKFLDVFRCFQCFCFWCPQLSKNHEHSGSASSPGNSPDNEMINVDQDSAPKKPKRTGKSLPVAQRLKFENYIERWLARRGIIFKTWTHFHRRHIVCVHLGWYFSKRQILGPKWNTIGLVKRLRRTYSKDIYSDPTSCIHIIPYS